jgi:hypothetical protein
LTALAATGSRSAALASGLALDCDAIASLLAALDSFKQLGSESMELLGSIVGADYIDDIAHALPWYVVASAHPGALLADVYHREPKEFEARCLRLAAFRAFMGAVASGMHPRDAVSQAVRAQRQRMVDDLNRRLLPPEEHHDGVPVQPVYFDVVKADELDEAALHGQLAKIFDVLGQDLSSFQITVTRVPDPPPEPDSDDDDNGNDDDDDDGNDDGEPGAADDDSEPDSDDAPDGDAPDGDTPDVKAKSTRSRKRS